jgi:hypothetical protein
LSIIGVISLGDQQRRDAEFQDLGPLHGRQHPILCGVQNGSLFGPAGLGPVNLCGANMMPCLKRAIVGLAVGLFFAGAAQAQLANIKVVTDANPDYSDMESMVRSITSKWETDADKMWALFYWDHLARRQTHPMWLHGYELTDPIRQYNDYGFTMCSTISGVKCSEWNYMGYPCRF